MDPTRDLAALTVLDEQGADVPMASLWRDRTAVIALVRHFGWLFCREQVVQLHHAIDRIHAAGAELHVIGNGAPMFIAGFRADTGYTGPLYTDPSLAVYAAANLKRGVSTLVRPSVLGHTVRALKGGFRQKKTMGDALQQGGVLIVSPEGRLRWRYVSDTAGDHPPVETILARLAA